MIKPPVKWLGRQLRCEAWKCKCGDVTCWQLLLDLTQNISFLSSTSASVLFSVWPVLFLSLQESVLQQPDSSGWRQSGCVGGSPHPPSGSQLYQPHHRRGLQGPQGRTCLVSTLLPKMTPSPTTDSLGLYPSWRWGKYVSLGSRESGDVLILVCLCEIWYLSLCSPFIWL